MVASGSGTRTRQRLLDPVLTDKRHHLEIGDTACDNEYFVRERLIRMMVIAFFSGKDSEALEQKLAFMYILPEKSTLPF